MKIDLSKRRNLISLYNRDRLPLEYQSLYRSRLQWSKVNWSRTKSNYLKSLTANRRVYQTIIRFTVPCEQPINFYRLHPRFDRILFLSSIAGVWATVINQERFMIPIIGDKRFFQHRCDCSTSTIFLPFPFSVL